MADRHPSAAHVSAGEPADRLVSLAYAARDLGYASHYDPNTWLHDEIMRVIADSALVRPGEKKLVLVGTDRGRFNRENFQLTAVQNRLPLEVQTTAYETDWGRLLDLARATSYFVYKQGGEPESPFFNTRSYEVIAYLRNSPEWVEIPFGRPLPDGGTAHILRRRADPLVRAVPPGLAFRPFRSAP